MSFHPWSASIPSRISRESGERTSARTRFPAGVRHRVPGAPLTSNSSRAVSSDVIVIWPIPQLAPLAGSVPFTCSVARPRSRSPALRWSISARSWSCLMSALAESLSDSVIIRSSSSRVVRVMAGPSGGA